MLSFKKNFGTTLYCLRMQPALCTKCLGKPFRCCFQWCFVHFNIAERMMLLLQCMLITIHRQEKCMFSCLLFTREGVAIFKKRGFVINFI